MKQKILVVDDEPAALELLEHQLSTAGYATLRAGEGTQALAVAQAERPDLIVLDVMLPGPEGFEVCRLLRRVNDTAEIPVIFLSARGEELDRIVAFELGAEDYVTKPYSPRELLLRIRRALGRSRVAPAHGVFSCGVLTVDLPRHEVTLQGSRVLLTATEFRLLEVLVQRAGYLFTREQLLQEVWHYEAGLESRTVDTHIRRLREKMGPAACHLETVRGAGYRFVREV